MPAKRLSMRKIKEVLRLKWGKGMSNRQIATSCSIGRPTVAEYLRRAQEAGVSWPLPADLDDTQLERMLFPPPPDMPAQLRGIPDWQAIHNELRHKHVTLFLLWQEYRTAHPDGYQYSWFCDHYRTWQGKLDMVMRQDHRAGEKLFVDMVIYQSTSAFGSVICVPALSRAKPPSTTPGPTVSRSSLYSRVFRDPLGVDTLDISASNAIHHGAFHVGSIGIGEIEIKHCGSGWQGHDRLLH